MSDGNGTGRHRLVVGVDGSQASLAALRWALDEAARRAARLEAVIAWRPSATLGPPAGRPGPSGRTVEERASDAEEILDTTLASLPPRPEVEIERRVMHGTPHRVLLEAAAGADLLVIGGRSTRLAGKLPWSTGQQLVRETRCPVVVVPCEWAQAQERPAEGQAPASAAAGAAPGGLLP